jgi:hypothetical protein
MNEQDKAQTLPLWIAAGISVAALALLAFKGRLEINELAPTFDDVPTIVLLVLAAAPWLACSIKGFQFGDLKVDFHEIREKQQQHDAELRQHFQYLAELFNGMVGDRGRELLMHLQHKTPFIYHYTDDTKDENRTLLRQLRMLGFVNLNDNAHHLIDDKRPEINLTDHIQLTPRGAAYLRSPLYRVATVGSEEMAEPQLSPPPESLRTQLGMLQIRIGVHGSRLWQLPLTYLGVLVVSLSQFDRQDPVFAPWFVFSSLAIFGVLLLWCMYGAFEGYSRTVRDMNDVERKLSLVETTKNRISHYAPYFGILILGIIFTVGASVYFYASQPDSN